MLRKFSIPRARSEGSVIWGMLFFLFKIWNLVLPITFFVEQVFKILISILVEFSSIMMVEKMQSAGKIAREINVEASGV
jgi:hypothetical protein